MTFKFRALFLPLLLLSTYLPFTALGQATIFPTDLSKWIVTAPPKLGTDRWYAANYSNSEWKVSLRRGKIAVSALDQTKSRQNSKSLPFSPTQKTRGEQFFTQVNDGWIVGFNAGEWGGSLRWYSPRGDKTYPISKDQISGFLPTRVGLLALEGLAHMGLNKGQIIHLHKDFKGRWTSSRFVNLKHAPEAATQDTDGSIVVATTDRLLRVRLDKKIEVLLSHTFWGGLYPNSLAITPANEIYIGMRHGVARVSVRIKKTDVKWLLPNHTFVHAKPHL